MLPRAQEEHTSVTKKKTDHFNTSKNSGRAQCDKKNGSFQYLQEFGKSIHIVTKKRLISTLPRIQKEHSVTKKNG